MTLPLEILYEDNHLLAVVKPAGLLTQGVPQGLPTLEGAVKAYLKERYHKPGKVYLGIPHRLDRPVSGVVVFARQTRSAQRLAEQFQKRQVQKLYWAAVEGHVEAASGTWEDWLRKVPDQARAEPAQPGEEEAKLAQLTWRVLQPFPGGTLLEIEPHTGRMHQIRVQAAWHGHPVLGDALYGATTSFGPPAERPRDRMIALHARSLTILHPIRYEPLTFTAPLPPAWTAVGIQLS